MAIAQTRSAGVRATRLTTLVSDTENRLIARRARATGVSISAYLRECALGVSPDTDERDALDRIDALIEKMEADIAGAVAAVAATLARMEAAA